MEYWILGSVLLAIVSIIALERRIDAAAQHTDDRFDRIERLLKDQAVDLEVAIRDAAKGKSRTGTDTLDSPATQD